MKYFVLTIFSATLIFSQPLWSDSPYDDEREWKRHSTQYQQPDKTTSNQSLYEKECGSCHMAYPAAALPQRSWQKIMATLDEHFGDSAELDEETHNAIAQYLNSFDAKETTSRNLKKLQKDLQNNNTPVRITELPYFKHKHNGIPDIVKKNPKVGSLSQCNHCHRDALTGGFDKYEIFIPDYGPWDD